MIAEPLEKGLAEDIENEVVQITWNRLDRFHLQGSHFGLCLVPCCHPSFFAVVLDMMYAEWVTVFQKGRIYGPGATLSSFFQKEAGRVLPNKV